jgi:hypothetical protein
MRRLARVLFSVFGVVLLLTGAIVIKFWYDDRQVEDFYSTHPMLRAFRESNRTIAQAVLRPNDPWPHITDTLLSRITPGLHRNDAEKILQAEGIDCAPSSGPQKEALLVCGVRSKPSGVPRWYIEISFDQENAVSGGRVLMLKG